MKTKLAAALAAVLTLGAANAASAQDYRRGDSWRPRPEIIVQTPSGRWMTFERGDRMFYRLMDQPYSFRAGFTYAYTDRCNRAGCIVFVFDDYRRRPIDRIFAPHLPHPRYVWRHARGFDRDYRTFGSYDRDEGGWDNDYDRRYREGRSDYDGWEDPRREEWRDHPRTDRAPSAAQRPDRGPRRGDGSGLEGGPQL